jgi:hypothetical protein
MTEGKAGHSAGTVAPQTLERQGRQQGAQDKTSAVPGWPRLLNVEQAAAYLNVSWWTLREFINAGTVPTVRLPRPQTDRMRRRRPVTDTVRRLLIDRQDLDALVERWKE